MKNWKEILTLAWPLIIANSFWNIQLTIDRIFLGMYSTESLGASMAVTGVYWVPMALLQQTAAYIMTFVAQYYGANEYENIGASLWQSIYLSIIGGVGFLLLNFLSPLMFGWMGHPPATQVLEIEYFNALTWTALPTALVAAFCGFFTGIGKPMAIIGINLIGLVLNSLLAYALVFGHWGFPALGIKGAGYATAIANYSSVLLGLLLLFTREYEALYKVRSCWNFNFNLFKKFLKFGVPSGMQWALEGLAFTIFLVFLGQYSNGDAALSSSSIAVTVMMLAVLPSMGVAQAVLTLVGQHLGEKNPDKAVESTWAGIQITLIYISLMAISFFLIPEFYLSWFKNEENAHLWKEVSVLVPRILKIVGIFTIMDSIYFNVSFALKGAGDTRFVSLVSLIIPWPLMVLPAYLVRDWPYAVEWAWSLAVLSSVTLTCILYWRFKQGRWKTMSVIHES